MQRAVVIANGDIGDVEFCRRQIQEGDYIICADGGLRHALAMGVCPHLVMGDGDSLSAGLRREMEGLHLELQRFPKIDQEESDLEMALNHAVSLEPGEIIVYGALGGPRADHGFINMLLLSIPFNRGIPSRIIDGRQEIQLMERELKITGGRGDWLSLFALTAEVSGVTTEGLQYPLSGETLYFASSRGLSNRFTGTTARVTSASGRLLVIKNSAR